MEYNVTIQVNGFKKELEIKTKMMLIPRIDERIESEYISNYLQDKIENVGNGKIFEVEYVRYVYNADFTKIDYIYIEIRKIIY